MPSALAHRVMCAASSHEPACGRPLGAKGSLRRAAPVLDPKGAAPQIPHYPLEAQKRMIISILINHDPNNFLVGLCHH